METIAISGHTVTSDNGNASSDIEEHHWLCGESMSVYTDNC